MSIIYILSQGDYERNKNVLVTTNVKQVVNKYVNLIKNGGYGSPFDNPYIEIWENTSNQEMPIAYFHEDNDNEQQLVKYLSKLGNVKM